MKIIADIVNDILDSVEEKVSERQKEHSEMTMTPDECFDEMAVALGVPKDTGYIDLLDLVKKLKQIHQEILMELCCKDKFGEDVSWKDIADLAHYEENKEMIEKEYEEEYGGTNSD